jgi:hypothetical protein
VVNFSGRRDRKMMISLTLEGLLMLSHSPTVLYWPSLRWELGDVPSPRQGRLPRVATAATVPPAHRCDRNLHVGPKEPIHHAAASPSRIRPSR